MYVCCLNRSSDGSSRIGTDKGRFADSKCADSGLSFQGRERAAVCDERARRKEKRHDDKTPCFNAIHTVNRKPNHTTWYANSAETVPGHAPSGHNRNSEREFKNQDEILRIQLGSLDRHGLGPLIFRIRPDPFQSSSLKNRVSQSSSVGHVPPSVHGSVRPCTFYFGAFAVCRVDNINHIGRSEFGQQPPLTILLQPRSLPNDIHSQGRHCSYAPFANVVLHKSILGLGS